jgi:hypothetical protein
LVHKEGTSVILRFDPPNGFIRTVVRKGSFAEYLQNFPLKPAETKVYLYNGQEKIGYSKIFVED